MINATVTPATATTELVNYAKGFAGYELWATKTTVEWLKTKDATLLETPVVSSYGTIKDTLKHMWDTSAWWLKNLRGEHPSLTFGPFECNESVAEVLEGVVKQAEELMELVSSMTPEQLAQTYPVTIPFTGDFNIPGYEILSQITHHTTYHRGQIVTMGRHLGITDASNTDYMFYLLVGEKRY